MLLGWVPALALAAVLGVATIALRRPAPAAAAWTGEAALLLVLFAVWQEGLGLGAVRVDGGFGHGMDVWRLERWLHVANERTIQRAVLRAPAAMRALNYFYADAHVQDVLLAAVWLFWRHRADYARSRNTLALVTFVAMCIQFVPVAPPRLLPATGVVDAGRLLGYAVYSPNGLHDPSQLTAMPSVHVAWALWVAVVVIRSSTSRWRWLVVAHPVVTTLAVIATGYHFWADAVVAAALVVAAAAVLAACSDRWMAPPTVRAAA